MAVSEGSRGPASKRIPLLAGCPFPPHLEDALKGNLPGEGARATADQVAQVHLSR